MSEKHNDEDRKMAVLSYIHVLCLVPLFTVKHKDEFTKFHVRQGVVLFFAELLVFFIVSYARRFLWVLGSIPGMAANVIFLAISAYAIWKAWNGEKWEIPIIKKLAAHFDVR